MFFLILIFLIRGGLRLLCSGANNKELVDCYIKQARSVLGYCAVWDAGLSQVIIADIERVQKSACSIIQGKNYVCYQSPMAVLGLDRLNARRDILSLKFTKKAYKSKKYSRWFVKDTNEPNTRKISQYCKRSSVQN